MMNPLEPTLFRLRVRYVKEGRLRYLGHLEVAHTIERCVRRAGLPYAVTQGFSPHMRVAFSAALPVGTGSSGEWYDLVLTEYVPVAEALPRLAAATPRDLAPVEAGYVNMRSETLGALITRQDYAVRVALRPEAAAACGRSGEAGASDAAAVLPVARAALETLVGEGSIAYQRGKKSKTLDVATLLAGWDLEACAGEDGPAQLALALRTRSSNAGSLRPEVLLAAWDARFGLSDPAAAIESTGIARYANFARVEIVRTDQYGVDEAGERIDPLA